MSLLKEPPRTTLPAAPTPHSPLPPDTEQGLIEDARRRERRRRMGIAVVVAVLGTVLAVALIGSGGGGAGHKSASSLPGAVATAGDASREAGPLRLAPGLEAGDVGWASESKGNQGGCCFVLNHSAQIEAAVNLHQSSKILHGGSHRALRHQALTVTVVTSPGVSAVSLHGSKPVPTHSDGLPFGLRVAILHGPWNVWPGNEAALAAFNALGRKIPIRSELEAGKPVLGAIPVPIRGWSFEGPGRKNWRFPQTPPSGPCELSASPLAGLTTLGGATIARVTGYRVFSRAFQSCVSTDYRRGGHLLIAAVLLDAEHPGGPPYPLPDMTSVNGAPGFVEAPSTDDQFKSSLFFINNPNSSATAVLFEPSGPPEGEKALTAERLSDAWLVVAGGGSAAQRLEVLRDLHASIHLSG